MGRREDSLCSPGRTRQDPAPVSMVPSLEPCSAPLDPSHVLGVHEQPRAARVALPAVGVHTVVGALFLVAAAIRLWAAIGIWGMVWPDEIFQTLEQGHRFAFGLGMIPWEFRDGARSWVFPGLLGLAYKAASTLGVTKALTFVRIMKVGMAAFSILGVRRHDPPRKAPGGSAPSSSPRSSAPSAPSSSSSQAAARRRSRPRPWWSSRPTCSRSPRARGALRSPGRSWPSPSSSATRQG